MISFHRRRESPPFVDLEPLRKLDGLAFFHATLRQGLYRFFTQPSTRGKWRRALLPDYVPEGIYAPLRDAGLSIAFYPVGLDLSVDADALKSARAAQDSDVVVYIHHFGLYREDNLRAVRAALVPGVLLIEDFALTLPNAGMDLSGDLALFSFTKMLGVADGGLVWFRDRDLMELPLPTASIGKQGVAVVNERGRTLVARMAANLAFEDWIQRWRPSPRIQALVRRLLGKRVSYYPHLTRHYRTIDAPVSAESLRVLESMDFEAVLSRRREIVRLYLAGLEARFQLGAPVEAYLRQALVAFPIQVDDQDRFHAYLAHRGFLGFRLTDSWWFQDGVRPSDLHRRHYLLPAVHYLADREIQAVIACVNGYPTRQFRALG